jgi:hypothetical protein
MNRRVLLSIVLIVVCGAVICGMALQQGQLTRLRAEQRQFVAQLTPSPDSPAQMASVSPETRLVTSPVPSELLRLRNEVTRLTERRRELAGVQAENERLQAQLASQGTNAAAGTRPPPGYLRRSEARMVGYNTPEDTIQSLLWAIHSHNFTNLLQVFTADEAEGMRDRVSQSKRSIKEYLQGAEAVPGMAVVSRKEGADGPESLEVEVEIGPNLPHEWISLRQVGGQWKIAQQF